jgi:uncharacterized protein (TIGR02117 family)
VQRESLVARRRRKSKAGKWVGRAIVALLAIPAAYLLAALGGSLIAANPGWTEPERGISVYLDTPTWWDITPRTIWSALAGGKRVMHVEYVADPAYAVREIQLRPEEYRRLWTAIRADFALDANSRPIHLDHPGYGPADTFYLASGKANAVRTCNAVVAGWLRLAGVKASAWPPFVNGLVWRYRRTATGRSG